MNAATGAPPPAPKEGFSALDTLALARELRGLGKAWFDKAYELPGDRVAVTLKVQGQGRWELQVAPGRFALLRPATGERPDEPGRLGAELRRVLSGAPLLEVSQPEGERYLELSFGRGGDESPALLVLELFGTGNVLAVRQGRIAAVWRARAWAGRTLRPGEVYARPPARKDPFTLTAGEVLAQLLRSRTDRTATVAARLGLGGPLAEEVLQRAGVDPRGTASSEASEVAERLVGALAALRGAVEDPPRGYLYRTAPDGPPVDATPFASVRWSAAGGIREEPLPRFSEAAAVYFAERAPPPSTSAASKLAAVREARRQELDRQRVQQRTAVEGLEAASAEERSVADLILSHFEEAEAARESARRAAPDEPEVEILLGGRRLRVRARGALRDEAQRFYDAAKRRRPKVEGARRALATTEGELASLRREEAESLRRAEAAEERVARSAATTTPSASPPSAAAASDRRALPPRKKHFWFEKAPRWFVSSEGIVAVAGRDAKSNDAIVKRYLRERDVYAHADLQGAPSVVVKRPAPGQGEVGERTLREVCQWGVSYSKAWRAGLASADAFWVEGEQVSKAGASGEFVARGSWVIHGSRNYQRDLPLEVELGVVGYEGEFLLQAGPPSSFTGPGRRVLWHLRPGDEREREAIERSIAQDLGITRELVQALLPPGGLSARRA